MQEVHCWDPRNELSLTENGLPMQIMAAMISCSHLSSSIPWNRSGDEQFMLKGDDVAAVSLTDPPFLKLVIFRFTGSRASRIRRSTNCELRRVIFVDDMLDRWSRLLIGGN